jgi:cytochrome c-type biogenesis protein CcmH
MMFWVMAAVMTVAATLVLLIPLARVTRSQGDEKAFDAEVYHDQLRELERDIEAGLLTGEEADYARAEVARRLLKASREQPHHSRSPRPLAGAARYVVIVFVPVMAVTGYLAIGSPGMPSQPLAARMQPPDEDNRDIAALVAQAENHLAANPQDGRGWDVLAPIYFRLGRLQDSEMAYRNAIRLLGSSAQRQSGLGQTLFARSSGIVTADVQAAFEAAEEHLPGNPLSAFFLSLGLAQEGRLEEARAGFAGLADRSSPEDPWMQQVRLQLAELDRQLEPNDGVTPPGPDEEQVAAAAEMSDEDRGAMIAGMVEGLDQRLREDPDDLQGWIRLIRSYMVLEQPDRASDALQRALAHFESGSDAQLQLTRTAADFGLAPEKVEQ